MARKRIVYLGCSRVSCTPPAKTFPDDPFLLLPRPGAVTPSGTDREPLSCSRDNFEILAVRHMFAHMNSWNKSPGDSLTIEHHPLRGVTYTLTLLRRSQKKLPTWWMEYITTTRVPSRRRMAELFPERIWHARMVN